ncbi:MAG: DUF7507 domain-containing protein [Planctomycetota bacterium]|jgi:hypothetical protein
MRKLKCLFLGILVVGLAVAGTARAETPTGCNTNTINLSLSRTPSKGLHDDVIEFEVTVLVPFLTSSDPCSCQVQDITIRFWPPYDPPSDTDNPCDDVSAEPIVLATGLTLDPGEVVDFNSADDANLSYIIAHADEDVNGLIRAWACAIGQSQLGTPEQAKDERATNVQVYHPDINIEKDPNRSNICEGADTLVSWIYTVTNPGDVNLEDVVVTDDECDPVNYVSGDTGDDGILEPGETWIYECNDVISGELTNTATVTANDVELGSTVEDSNDATVLSEAPTCDDIIGDTTPDCDSNDNVLSVLASGGTPPYGYSWTSSDDVNWPITSGADTNQITYDAGPPGTSATFCVDINDAQDCNVQCCIEIDCGAPPGDTFCTFTQGFWGNAGGKYDGNDTQALLEEYFAEMTSLTIGDGNNSVTLWDANCVLERLPAGGKPRCLPSSLGQVNDDCETTIPKLPLKGSNKKGARYSNVLMGQVIALTLNMWLDGGLGGLELPEGYFCVQPEEEGACAGQWMIPQAILDAGVVTVQDLLDLANEELDDCDTGLSISDIYNAVTTINEAFDECGTIIDCPETETDCDDGCDNDFDTYIDCLDSDCAADPCCVA